MSDAEKIKAIEAELRDFIALQKHLAKEDFRNLPLDRAWHVLRNIDRIIGIDLPR